jgi:hypothetical protein
MMNQEQTEHEVVRLAEAWATAELRGDAAFLERTLTDDFIGIGPLGFMLTKQAWLARHQSSDLKYDSFSLDEVKVRVYNDAAIMGIQTVLGVIPQVYHITPLEVIGREVLPAVADL